MSKSRPDADKLANELSGASAFFRSSAGPTQQPPEPETREASTAPVQPPVAPITPEPKAESDVMTSRRQSVTTSPSSASAGFDLNRPTTSRDSLRLSLDETKALDELRQALKWDFDLTVSKNDICRAALHWLLDDFASKGDKSVAVSRLKRKQTSR